MPFPAKVQPIDSQTFRESTTIRNDAAPKPVLKSRLKRLFDRPFNSVLRISSAAAEKQTVGKDVAEYFEPSSVCLDNMVQNFIEDSNERPQSQATVKCGRNRCNCFNGNGNDSSDDELDFFDPYSSSNHSSFADFADSLKSLIPCASTAERNLLADTSKIAEKNKTCRRKHDLRKVVTDGLLALGYNSSICKSKWEKSSSVPAGEYEYIEVIVEGERILVDVDFRSEFEIARSTGSYKTILQSLPFIFVGKAERLLQIILIVSEAARLSLKKKGMHIAPWRKADYIKAKWLSPFTRISPPPTQPPNDVTPLDDAVVEEVKDVTDAVEEEVKDEIDAVVDEVKDENVAVVDDVKDENDAVVGEQGQHSVADEGGELDLLFGKETLSFEVEAHSSQEESVAVDGDKLTSQLPSARGNKVMVTGLASLLKENS